MCDTKVSICMQLGTDSWCTCYAWCIQKSIGWCLPVLCTPESIGCWNWSM